MSGRRGRRLGAEGPGEVPFAHGRPAGEGGDAEVRSEVVGQPALHLGDSWRASRLGLQLGAELRLAAGSSGEHDQPARHGVGDLGAVVVVDQRQGQVDPSGHPRRGPAVTVLDVDAIRFDDHGWTALGQLVAPGPVRRGPIAIKQPGGGKHEGSGAHRRDPPGVACNGGELIQVFGVGRDAARSEPADHQEGVNGKAGPGHLGQRHVGRDLDTARGTHRPPVRRDHHTLVAGCRADPGSEVEDIDRSGQVKQLEVVVGDDDERAVTGHVCSVRHSRSGVNDNNLTISATR